MADVISEALDRLDRALMCCEEIVDILWRDSINYGEIGTRQTVTDAMAAAKNASDDLEAARDALEKLEEEGEG